MRGERERKPLHRRLRAAEDLEDGILFRQDAPDGVRRKNFESLKLAQVQQAHQRINISTLQINIEDRAGRPGIGKRAQLRCSNDLQAQVGGSIDESPIRAQGIFGVGSYRALSLRAGTRFYCAVAEAATVWTATIPLGKAAPGYVA